MELEILQQNVATCIKCPELVANRTRTVFGEGNPKTKLLVIGEAGGRNEDLLGRPFVGAAGRLLDNIFAACKWNREDLFISNTCRCRPPSNRTPTDEEVENCRPHLDALIEAINPQFILALGSTASKALTGTPIGQARLNHGEYKGIKVICTYHPAYILRNPDAKKDVWNDLEFLRNHLTHLSK